MARDKGRQRYLHRQSGSAPWLLEGPLKGDYRGAVVIPALAEGDALWSTLEHLLAQSGGWPDDWLVVVVINGRDNSDPQQLAVNLRDLEQLRSGRFDHAPVGWVDASRDGYRLPVKRGGVGMARKLGCDLALPYLREDGLLVHLDADCRVEATYLHSVQHYFADHSGGAVLPFCHPLPKVPAHRQAMIAYELYLRCHRLGLEWAGSPYAYHAIGSTMATTADAYIKAGGMNCRQAGEDFYFLQQVAKTSGVGCIEGTVVWPSSRVSQRTPFGTGQVIAAAAAHGLQKLYHPQTYAIVGDWLRSVVSHPRETVQQLVRRATVIDAGLERFLREEGFAERWQQLCATHENSERRLRAFHEWFDGLKTLRCLHALGQTYPVAEAIEQVPRLFELWGWPVCSNLEEALIRLRRHDLPWLPEGHLAF
nr:hypothetical protein [uncultured Desulfuromonas sp.]